jgi:5'-deoxynucleotidase YfbR-like HD superfamily hydrolase
MWEEILLLREEFEEGKTPEAKLLKQLDKLDAAIRALEYERQWYTNNRMDEFYPDVMSKLEYPDLKKIFEILLKKKYNHINYIDQYYFLLKYNWDEKYFDEAIKESL